MRAPGPALDPLAFLWRLCGDSFFPYRFSWGEGSDTVRFQTPRHGTWLLYFILSVISGGGSYPRAGPGMFPRRSRGARGAAGAPGTARPLHGPTAPTSGQRCPPQLPPAVPSAAPRQGPARPAPAAPPPKPQKAKGKRRRGGGSGTRGRHREGAATGAVPRCCKWHGGCKWHSRSCEMKRVTEFLPVGISCQNSICRKD